MKLHTYFRSSAAFRVRIALELKRLPYDAVPVHLVRGGGEHLSAGFAALNPAQLVPVLETDDGERLAQSIAIVEYLDEIAPEPPLLGRTPLERARVRAFALDIACEIHPLNNLRVLKLLTGSFGFDEAQKTAWYRHWVETGLAVVEQRVEAGSSFCLGERPTLADCCLVPQIFNARRFDCRLDHLPRLVAIHERCMALPEFRAAAPEAQPDADA